MANLVVVETDSEASCSIPNPTSLSSSLSHRFLDSKFYLLVVIGELVTEEHLRRAIANIERGAHHPICVHVPPVLPDSEPLRRVRAPGIRPRRSATAGRAPCGARRWQRLPAAIRTKIRSRLDVYRAPLSIPRSV